jgi:formate hydrogenlyase subunit 4
VNEVLTALALILLAPLAGGLLNGIDRRLTARMQRRIGPPILQPFYDFLKLWSKGKTGANQAQSFFLYLFLFWTVTALVLLALQQDLLIIVFVMAFGGISFIMAGFSVKSPYSYLGSHREVLQMLAYEPVLILVALGVYLVNKTFMVGTIFETPVPLLYSLPLVFLALLWILTIKMRKSPFDFSASHHAHQELVRGIYTEFSGRQLAVIELAHWYELVWILAFVALFWTPNILVGAALAFFAFFMELVIDNVSSRMTWSWMLRSTWGIAVTISVINIIWLYFARR